MNGRIERDVECLMRGESAETDFLNDVNWESYLANADYEYCLSRINYSQRSYSI